MISPNHREAGKAWPMARGFTLIEVMVALAVFAVLSMALIKSAAGTSQQTLRLEDKTLALIIAQNRMNEMRIVEKGKTRLPAKGRQREAVKLADRSWEVVVDVSATDNPAIHRVDIEVFAGQEARGEPASLILLSGFIGQH
ncbi:MAG: type II secretion system minor pseudopilin GspI [Gammaproteobacteria bacterium]|nr:type II secretion system minor pseudopilin GspI [Gammaproteobacteria bacterium]